MEAPKVVLRTSDEVQAFLSLLADQRVRRQLADATSNKRIYHEISKVMPQHDHTWTLKQRRDKLKRLKSDYSYVSAHRARKRVANQL